MAEADDLVAIEEVLQQMERISFVAHRDARAALPSIRAFGPAIARAWIEAARDLFLHDRECGKSFMRHSERLAENTGVVEPWISQSREFLQWVNSHYALEGFLAQADRVWSVWGEAGEREWFALGLRWCGRSLADARAYFEAPFDRLDAGQGPAGLRTLIEPAEKLYDERGLALDCYLAGAPMARNMVGDAGLLNWARRGADLLAAGRSRGEAYFRMESEEGLKLLLEALPGYRPGRTAVSCSSCCAPGSKPTFRSRTATGNREKGARCSRPTGGGFISPRSSAAATRRSSRCSTALRTSRSTVTRGKVWRPCSGAPVPNTRRSTTGTGSPGARCSLPSPSACSASRSCSTSPKTCV
jgi:hypothetical protein